MNRMRLLGPLILLIAIVVIGYGWFKTEPVLDERSQKAASDAAKTKGKIRIDMDGWKGYFVLRSPEFKSAMRRSGWIVVPKDDEGDYATRMERLKNSEIEFAVATVDSYILNAEPKGFPGTIVMVIDESHGGDAIVGRKDKVSNLDDIKSLGNLKVAFMPDSPSHHLIKATSDHFSVPEILPSGPNRIEGASQSEVLKALNSGKADVAVLWEPYVTKALKNKDNIKLLGTELTEKLIVDILIVRRKWADKNPNVVKLFMKNYFKALKKYRDNEDLLIAHSKKVDGERNEADIKSSVAGVKWANFHENCEKWFGISSSTGEEEDLAEGLIETIESTKDILVNSGDFPDNPIPDENPYRLTNVTYLSELAKSGIGQGGFTAAAARIGGAASPALSSLETPFAALSSGLWRKLREVGTLKVGDINFKGTSDSLDLIAKDTVDKAVARLKHYPKLRVKIKGHTGTRGDEGENIKLSRLRADSVLSYMTGVYGIDENRLKAEGFGGREPLRKKPGENRRKYQRRLNRVALVLVAEDI